jgi:hypothetical protein
MVFLDVLCTLQKLFGSVPLEYSEMWRYTITIHLFLKHIITILVFSQECRKIRMEIT